MQKIAVLMSTYNGEKFLRLQLDSIFSQKDVEVHLFVRDDGSKDSTLSILEEYSKKYYLEYYTGDNLKPAKSFMDLIYKIDGFDYYALSDQDDYWLDKKLISGIEKMNTNSPMLYYCGMDISDSNLKHADYYFRKNNYSSSYKFSTFFGSEIAGCTMIFNNCLREYLKLYHPNYIPMHDTWIHKVCLAIGGKVISDSNYLIKYRIHGNNVIGMKKNTLSKRIKSFRNKNHNYSRLSQEIYLGFNKYMDEETIKFSKKFSKYGLHIVSLTFTKFGFRIGIKSRIKMFIKMITRVY